MMKFVDLLHRDMDKLAEVLSSGMAKHFQMQRVMCKEDWKWQNIVLGPLKCSGGTDSAGPGIDMYSMNNVGVCGGITPFNFPSMIPMWMFAPSIVCGNAFILKPSERDPSVPILLAELMEEAGLPKGTTSHQWNKVSVDAMLSNPQYSQLGLLVRHQLPNIFMGQVVLMENVFSALVGIKTT